jgi:hypothetical protein
VTNKVLFLSALVLGFLLQCFNLWADDDAIMDVDDNAASFFGTWTTSQVRILYYGDDYQYAAGAGVGQPATATATFTTAQAADISGIYHVYVRWTAGAVRATSAVYTIRDDLNAFRGRCVKDQRFNGGAWQFCDEVFLPAGRRGRVVLGNENEPTNRYLIADGVRFVRQSWDRYDLVDEAGGDFSASSNNEEPVTGTDEIVKSVFISAPSSGKVIVNASGYFRFGSTTTVDGGRCCITTGNTIDFSHLIIADENQANIMDYVPFGATRGFNVSEGTTRFNLVCDSFSGTIRIGDPTMTAIFVPTTY